MSQQAIACPGLSDPRMQAWTPLLTWHTPLNSAAQQRWIAWPGCCVQQLPAALRVCSRLIRLLCAAISHFAHCRQIRPALRRDAARLLYAAHSHHCLQLELTAVLAVRSIVSISPSRVPFWRVIPWALGLSFPKLLPLHVGQGGLSLQSADIKMAFPSIGTGLGLDRPHMDPTEGLQSCCNRGD